MKRIIVCDSGLGGLNIAARFCNTGAPGLEACELIYFNAYPEAGMGFNKLPSSRSQEDLLQTVLESMEKFSPDMCLIACNTLSIVYEKLAARYTPGFPVLGITGAALEGMYGALQKEPASSLLVLGTKTTVDSGLYIRRLTDRQIHPSRLASLACPGLATALESDPRAPETVGMIERCARAAAELLPGNIPVLHLALCCTHFEFAGDLWTEKFSRFFTGRINIVNPNSLMQTGTAAANCRYLSRIGFFPGARENMIRFFSGNAPILACALEQAQADKNLFAFDSSVYKG